VVNEQALQMALRLGVAVGGRIRSHVHFARKNYFYPDLPKGYQITQYAEPLIEGGAFHIWWRGRLQAIPLLRIHLEEDAAKLIHDDTGHSFIDFNRSGIPLVEIVTAPVLRTPEQAGRFVQRVQQIVRYLQLSGAAMEWGQLRCDANLSLRQTTDDSLGIRTEIKNLNSFRAVRQALATEIRRQTRRLEQGKPVTAGTYRWEADTRTLQLMRTKEEEPDYRYFPDPDLVPFRLHDFDPEDIQADLPELPHVKERRWVETWGLSPTLARSLAEDPHRADYFETTVRAGVKPKLAAAWILQQIVPRVQPSGATPDWEHSVPPSRLAELLSELERGNLNQNSAKQVLEQMFTDLRPVREIVADGGFAQETDIGRLTKLIRQILADYPAERRRYREGEKRLLDFFMGRVMQATAGRADPHLVRRILEQSLQNG
jgi:aspartyl-tRNA(Asn)/glutamyl-tRNA(Gln) amidotransferase subunit B